MSDYLLRVLVDTLRFWMELLHSPLVQFLLVVFLGSTVIFLLLIRNAERRDDE